MMKQQACISGLWEARRRRFGGNASSLFAKVMADLIAEGQSEPAFLREFYDRHLSPRGAATVADVERAKASGSFTTDFAIGLKIRLRDATVLVNFERQQFRPIRHIRYSGRR